MTDADTTQMQKDLEFVKGALARRGEYPWTSVAVNTVWGVIILAGLSLYDFYPRILPWFWPVAVPVGWLLSWVIARRVQARVGEADKQLDRRETLHWVGLTVAIGLLWLLVGVGRLHGQAMGLPLLIVGALACYLAGIHLDPSFLWSGIVMAAGVVAGIFIKAYLPTMIGAAVCIALIGGALVRYRRRA